MLRAVQSARGMIFRPQALFAMGCNRCVHVGPTPQHYDTEENNENTPFDFTADNHRKVHAILNRYPKNYKQSAIMPLLHLVQDQCGNYISLAAMNKVAEICECPPKRVYEVVNFYSMYNKEKVGEFHIQLCGTTPCMLNGSEELRLTLEEELGIKEGETTKDGKFSLLHVECLGACSNAPMMQINNDYYESLTPQTAREVLAYIREHNALPPLNASGSKPMNGQESCEGPQGQTTLKGEIRGPFCRELPAQKVDPKKIYLDMYGDDFE